jgi:inward rectifier potassium channel
LSLSTTFGGSPVVALSPFCLLVANMNTLMAQFLFVFLSGGGEHFTPKSQSECD